MDDLQRQPRDGDRNPVRDRIKRAVADGRISKADGDIRLTNVDSAQSMSELGLIVRDLDQLEAALGQGVAAAPTSTWTPTPATTVDTAVAAATDGIRRTLPLLVGLLVLGLVAAGAVVFFVVAGGSDTKVAEARDLPSALPVSPSPPSDPGDPDPSPTADVPGAPEEPVGADFALTADGVPAFLATYRDRFGTTKVNDLTMYPDYVVVKVPVPGKNRSSGWLYRDGSFTEFGGVAANFPGTAEVDLRRLDVPALMRNIGKARRTLNVEDPTTTYVIVNYRPQFDDQPNVNVYVSNEFRESGYLATHLDGSFERAYPYSG